MIYTGACHCGAVSATYETSAPVRLRADGCSFCRTRGVKSASDPDGKLALTSAQKLTRYRFGHKSADFLICPICGTYVATYMESPRGSIGVINVIGLNIAELQHLPVTLTSLEGESPEERVARRISRWTPMTFCGAHMTEADVVSELVEFTNILLAGVGLIFSIVSAYVVALNYFIGQSNFIARFASFGFITLVLGMLVMVLLGAQDTHLGLIARLRELEAQHQLTAAGRALLSNSTPEWVGAITHRRYSIDDIVRTCIWAGLGFVYFGLLYLTFLHRWTADVINVAIEGQKGRK